MSANNTSLPIDTHALAAMDLPNLYVMMRGLRQIAGTTPHDKASGFSMSAAVQIENEIKARSPESDNDVALKLLAAIDCVADWSDVDMGNTTQSARKALGVFA